MRQACDEIRRAGKNDVAYLAELRVHELLEDGKNSLYPRASASQTLLANLRSEMLSIESDPKQRGDMEQQFKMLRADGSAYQALRTAYMMPRLKAGRHPDTDATFWNEWQEPTPPELFSRSDSRPRSFAISGGALLLSFAASSVGVKRRRGAKRFKA